MGMATRQRDEIMRGFFAAMGSSNGAAMADYMTESVRWWFPQSAAERGAAARSVAGLLGHVPQRPEVGRAAVLDVVGHADHFYQKLEYTLEHVLEDGDMVAAHATARGTTAIGHQYENEYHFLFRLEGDRIAEGWEFLDTAYVYARNT